MRVRARGCHQYFTDVRYHQGVHTEMNHATDFEQFDFNAKKGNCFIIRSTV